MYYYEMEYCICSRYVSKIQNEEGTQRFEIRPGGTNRDVAGRTAALGVSASVRAFRNRGLENFLRNCFPCNLPSVYAHFYDVISAPEREMVEKLRIRITRIVPSAQELRLTEKAWGIKVLDTCSEDI